ncbi:MAG: hypothetical protein MSIBF_00495 [Candidatus Altiarchaeales archaeon IMC4]|nr:MAG: hypothetical protein MSIBF_00495 [Candidatus Altiarchaeales archaeon IMC4]
MNHIKITKLGADAFAQAMENVLSGPGSDRIGCVVTFTGIVRKMSGGRVVKKLHLGLADTAEDKLRAIADEASRKHGIVNTAICHNLDDLAAKSPVVYIHVSAEHRAEAFDAVKEIVDRIKSEVHVDLVET